MNKLITYGCGNSFELAKFKPVKNVNFVKPEGGLWASPFDSKYGWREWCMREGFGDLSSSFTFQYSGRTLVVDREDDLLLMTWTRRGFPDFEAMVKRGIDAIYLTEKGEAETRLSVPYDLYSWDCECILIMNPIWATCKVVNGSTLPISTTATATPPYSLRAKRRCSGCRCME